MTVSCIVTQILKRREFELKVAKFKEVCELFIWTRDHGSPSIGRGLVHNGDFGFVSIRRFPRPVFLLVSAAKVPVTR